MRPNPQDRDRSQNNFGRLQHQPGFQSLTSLVSRAVLSPLLTIWLRPVFFVTVRDASVRLTGAFSFPEQHWSRRKHIDCRSTPTFVDLFVYTPVGPTIYMYTIYRPLYDRVPTARLQDILTMLL